MHPSTAAPCFRRRKTKPSNHDDENDENTHTHTHLVGWRFRQSNFCEEVNEGSPLDEVLVFRCCLEAICSSGPVGVVGWQEQSVVGLSTLRVLWSFAESLLCRRCASNLSLTSCIRSEDWCLSKESWVRNAPFSRSPRLSDICQYFSNSRCGRDCWPMSEPEE